MTKNIKITVPHGCYLDSVSEQIPSEPGLYLINAKTGVGKSFYMTKFADQNRGVCFYPVKAVMEQQKADCKERGIRTDNILQIENIDRDFAQIDSSKAIYFDECQLLYEGGFRKIIEKFRAMLLEQSKKKPVYCLSGTWNNGIDLMDWDVVIDVKSHFERTYTTINIEDKQDKEKTADGAANVSVYTKAILSSVTGLLVEHKDIPVICFIDSLAKLEEIKDGIEKTTQYKAAVITSDKKDTAVWDYIVQNQKIGGCGVDVVLCTQSLEAGINILDEVTIITEQSDPNRIFQRFGRARVSGNFYVIAGSGVDGVWIDGDMIKSSGGMTKKVEDYENARDRLQNGTCLFEDDRHRVNCDVYSKYNRLSMMMCNYAGVARGLEELGYKMSGLLVVSSDGDAIKKGDRKLMAEGMREYIQSNSGEGKLDWSMVPVGQAEEEKAARIAIEKMKAAGKKPEDIPSVGLVVAQNRTLIGFIKGVLATPEIKADPLDMFYRVNAFGRRWIQTLQYYDIAREVSKTLEGMAEKVEAIDLSTNEGLDMMQTVVDEWWALHITKTDKSEWWHEDSATHRTKLFRYMIGMVYDEDSRRMKATKDTGWWDVKLDRPDRLKLNRLTRAAEENGINVTPSQMCEATGLDLLDLTKNFTPKKLVKKLKESPDVIW